MALCSLNTSLHFFGFIWIINLIQHHKRELITAIKAVGMIHPLLRIVSVCFLVLFFCFGHHQLVKSLHALHLHLHLLFLHPEHQFVCCSLISYQKHAKWRKWSGWTQSHTLSWPATWSCQQNRPTNQHPQCDTFAYSHTAIRVGEGARTFIWPPMAQQANSTGIIYIILIET